MSWKNEVFEKFRLYAVTDMTRENQGAYAGKIESVYRGGADIVQLRSKSLSDLELLKIGKTVRRLADRYQKLFFVNDRLDLAIALEADGLHLGQEDIPVSAAKALALKSGTPLKIGKSTHSYEQALQAQKEGADYIAIGPVFQTPTKATYRPIGTGCMNAIRKNVRVPWVAIGGIEPGNLSIVLEAGATRIAVVRAIFSAENPEQAARALRNEMESHEPAGV